MKTKKKIIPQKKHQIVKNAISHNALKVLSRLNEAGYEAYLVGGGVRDLLLGEKPKDFDVATSARPEEVKRLFRNCRLIGRRFRLAHILYGRDVIEVATFRGPHEGKPSHHAGKNDEGRIVRDNVFGSIEEDAVRRDFTVNALYYDIRDESVVDFTGGMDDLKHKVLRMIGDVDTRYREDPVRMLRAVRFAAKLNFQIEKQAHSLIFEMGDLLENIPLARLFDEAIKLFQGGYGLRCFQLIREYQLFELLFPMTEKLIAEHAHNSFENRAQVLAIIEQALRNTDERIAIGKSVNPAFFLAVLLWQPMLEHKKYFISQLATTNSRHEMEALFYASREVIARQQAYLSIPKRLSLIIKEIWHMQPQLQHPTRKRALRTLTNKRFRAAYDFLLLRHSVGETELAPLCEWWTEIQTKSFAEQEEMCEQLTAQDQRKRKRRKRNKKPQLSSASAASPDVS